MSFTPEHPEFQSADPAEMEGPTQEMLRQLLDGIKGFAAQNYNKYMPVLNKEIAVVMQFAEEENQEVVYDFLYFPDGTKKMPNLVASIGVVEWPLDKPPVHSRNYNILSIPDGLAVESYNQKIQRTKLPVTERIEEDLLQEVELVREELEAVHKQEAELGLHSVNKGEIAKLLEVLPRLQPWHRSRD